MVVPPGPMAGDVSVAPRCVPVCASWWWRPAKCVMLKDLSSDSYFKFVWHIFSWPESDRNKSSIKWFLHVSTRILCSLDVINYNSPPTHLLFSTSGHISKANDSWLCWFVGPLPILLRLISRLVGEPQNLLTRNCRRCVCEFIISLLQLPLNWSSIIRMLVLFLHK